MPEQHEPGRPDDTNDTADSDDLRPVPAAGCSSCQRPLVWESRFDQWGERWLAVCDCGQIESFFCDRRHPEQEPPDPLVMFLQGHRAPRRPATPAWLRLFLHSTQAPLAVHWRHNPEPCPACENPARFALLAWPRHDVAAVCSLCLGCGHTHCNYQQPGTGQQLPPLEGTSWAPPGPAVKRLRSLIYRNDLDGDPGSGSLDE